MSASKALHWFQTLTSSTLAQFRMQARIEEDLEVTGPSLSKKVLLPRREPTLRTNHIRSPCSQISRKPNPHLFERILKLNPM